MKIECAFNHYTEAGVVYDYEHKGQLYQVWIPKRDFRYRSEAAPQNMTLYTTRKYKRVPKPEEYVKLVELNTSLMRQNQMLEDRINMLEKREQEQRTKVMQALNL